jgi:hypothetical protein
LKFSRFELMQLTLNQEKLRFADNPRTIRFLNPGRLGTDLKFTRVVSHFSEFV